VISRRNFCVLAGLGGLGPAFASSRAQARVPARHLAAGCVAAIRGQMAELPPGPVLLNSYLVEVGPGRTDFDLTQANAAYVYDNALAGLLLLAAGHEDDAARIGRALALAQANDRFWRDGRLRNAYQAGPMTAPAKLPGWWDEKAGRWDEDPYQAGSQTGPVAWAMLLWAALGMRAPAEAAGDWLNAQLRAPSGYYGGFYGFEPNPLKLTWQSTEQNTDLYAVFSKLGRAEDAAHAGGFVKAMFSGGVFGAGLGPDGARNGMLAADAGTWPYLAGLGSAQSARVAVKKLRQGKGIGFSDASQSVWLEGTAFAALALGRDPLAQVFLNTLGANLSPQGYVYATVSPALRTGLTVWPSLQPGVPAQAFNYYRRPALSTTSWAGLAALGVNPLG
jgi:hypothetical protein